MEQKKKNGAIVAIAAMVFLFAMISFVTNMAAPFGSPAAIKNGMYVPTSDGWYAPSDEWVFHSNGTPNPLSVLTHQQLLTYLQVALLALYLQLLLQYFEHLTYMKSLCF